MSKGRSQINRLIEESGLDAAAYADVAGALSTLQTLIPAQAPSPSAELAALLSAGVVVPLDGTRTRGSRTALTAAAAAVVVTLGTGVAAAANTLPDSAQRMFNHFSDRYLPFEFPLPEDRPAAPGNNLQDVLGQRDQGNHVGDGTGAGKTDNLGRPGHTTEGQGNADKPDAANGIGPGSDNSDNGQKVGSGGGNAGGNGNGNGGNSSDPRPADDVSSSEGHADNGKDPGVGRGNDNGKSPEEPRATRSTPNGQSNHARG